MNDKITINNTKLNVKKSENVKIGNISKKKQIESHNQPKNNMLDDVKKIGKLEKVLAIIFIIALVSLVVVLKSI